MPSALASASARAVIALSVFGAACRGNVTDETKGDGLASPSPEPAGERQSRSGVAGGLVDPPGPEAGQPRAEKNNSRKVVPLATAELLEGARDQRERLVSTTG